jgi:hypothetical protein
LQEASPVPCPSKGVSEFRYPQIPRTRHNVDRHHIFPRALFSDRQTADVVANIAFTSADANKHIRDAHPSVYLAKIPPKVLVSQAIPSKKSLWDIEQAQEFWQKRRELLSQAFNQYVHEALPNRRKL